MHETITVNGCPEYQARATAKVGLTLFILKKSPTLMFLYYTYNYIYAWLKTIFCHLKSN